MLFMEHGRMVDDVGIPDVGKHLDVDHASDPAAVIFIHSLLKHKCK